MDQGRNRAAEGDLHRRRFNHARHLRENFEGTGDVMANDSKIKNVPRARLAEAWDKMGMVAVFAVMFVVLSLCVPNFFNLTNMKGLALSVATVGIIACTMMFCL